MNPSDTDFENDHHNAPQPIEDAEFSAEFVENYAKEHDVKFESDGWNELSSLGNRAVTLNLIIGHGFHRGQYEVLHRSEALLMSPQEAIAYLQEIIQGAEH